MSYKYAIVWRLKVPMTSLSKCSIRNQPAYCRQNKLNFKSAAKRVIVIPLFPEFRWANQNKETGVWTASKCIRRISMYSAANAKSCGSVQSWRWPVLSLGRIWYSEGPANCRADSQVARREASCLGRNTAHPESTSHCSTDQTREAGKNKQKLLINNGIMEAMCATHSYIQNVCTLPTQFMWVFCIIPHWPLHPLQY
jgi:hypothetical protein